MPLMTRKRSSPRPERRLLRPPVIGQHDEIVSLAPVRLRGLCGVRLAVAEERVRVAVAAEPPAGRRKRAERRHRSLRNSRSGNSEVALPRGHAPAVQLFEERQQVLARGAEQVARLRDVHPAVLRQELLHPVARAAESSRDGRKCPGRAGSIRPPRPGRRARAGSPARPSPTRAAHSATVGTARPLSRDCASSFSRTAAKRPTHCGW